MLIQIQGPGEKGKGLCSDRHKLHSFWEVLYFSKICLPLQKARKYKWEQPCWAFNGYTPPVINLQEY